MAGDIAAVNSPERVQLQPTSFKHTLILSVHSGNIPLYCSTGLIYPFELDSKLISHDSKPTMTVRPVLIVADLLYCPVPCWFHYVWHSHGAAQRDAHRPQP